MQCCPPETLSVLDAGCVQPLVSAQAPGQCGEQEPAHLRLTDWWGTWAGKATGRVQCAAVTAWEVPGAVLVLRDGVWSITLRSR